MALSSDPRYNPPPSSWFSDLLSQVSSNIQAYIQNVPSGANVGSNLPVGNASQYASAYSSEGSYVPGTKPPAPIPGAYTVTTPGGARSRGYKFEDLSAHHIGTGGYTWYKYAPNQQPRKTLQKNKKGTGIQYSQGNFNIDPNLSGHTPEVINAMINSEVGTLSHLKNRPDRLVFDMTWKDPSLPKKTLDSGTQDGRKLCVLPSPLDGEVVEFKQYGVKTSGKKAGYWAGNSTLGIEGPEGRVRLLHMDEFYVKKGDKVVEGQPVGRQSNVMPSQKPPRDGGRAIHLHIEGPTDILKRYFDALWNGTYASGGTIT